MFDFVSKFEEAGIIARVTSLENARIMAEEGVGAFLCDNAQTAKEIKAALPELLVGSTELTSGVDFYVGDVHCPKCVARARAAEVLLVACAATTEEAKKVHELGADMIAFTDAAKNGGFAQHREMVEELPDAHFIVIGGADGRYYTELEHTLAWVDEDIDRAEDVRATARERMYLSIDLNLAHVGINGADEDEAIAISGAYSDLLGIKQKIGNSSCFAGSLIEVMKKPFLGERGHIAFGTCNLRRAIGFYNRKGVKFNMDTAKPVAIYFAEDIGGFAIHLVQR